MRLFLFDGVLSGFSCIWYSGWYSGCYGGCCSKWVIGKVRVGGLTVECGLNHCGGVSFVII